MTPSNSQILNTAKWSDVVVVKHRMNDSNTSKLIGKRGVFKSVNMHDFCEVEINGTVHVLHIKEVEKVR